MKHNNVEEIVIPAEKIPPANTDTKSLCKQCTLLLLALVLIVVVTLSVGIVFGLNALPRQNNTNDVLQNEDVTDDVIEDQTTTSPKKRNHPSGTTNDVATTSHLLMKSLVGLREGDKFGSSVSLSTEINVLAIGSVQHDDTGLVQTFGIDDGSSSDWRRFGSNLRGISDRERVGESVSVSGDGQWLAVGIPAPIESTGVVKLFLNVDGDWEQRGDTIFGASGDNIGRMFSLSYDGNRIAIAGSSLVRVYDYRDDDWIPVGYDFIFHSSPRIALSGDGSTIAIGDPESDSLKGSATMYRWSEDSDEWVQMGSEIVGDDVYGYFGSTVDITRNGNRIVVGTPSNGVNAYDYGDDEEWNPVGNPITSEYALDYSFGETLSIASLEGNTVVVGSPEFSSDDFPERGKVSVYRYDNSEWTKVGDDIVGEKEYDRFGFSVSVLGDGDYVAIGAPSDIINEKGQVYVYKISS